MKGIVTLGARAEHGHSHLLSHLVFNYIIRAFWTTRGFTLVQLLCIFLANTLRVFQLVVHISGASPFVKFHFSPFACRSSIILISTFCASLPFLLMFYFPIFWSCFCAFGCPTFVVYCFLQFPLLFRGFQLLFPLSSSLHFLLHIPYLSCFLFFLCLFYYGYRLGLCFDLFNFTFLSHNLLYTILVCTKIVCIYFGDNAQRKIKYMSRFTHLIIEREAATCTTMPIMNIFGMFLCFVSFPLSAMLCIDVLLCPSTVLVFETIFWIHLE